MVMPDDVHKHRFGERGTDVELRKSRRSLLQGTFSLVVGVFLLVYGRTDSPIRLIGVVVFAGISLLAGGALVVNALKPFRFHIGAEGLTLRLPRINRLVRWDEIGAIILDQPGPRSRGSGTQAPQLLLVPADGSDLSIPSTHRSPLDDRACLVLLQLNHVKESPEQVAETLARFGGSRSTDVRQLRRARISSPDFTVALRGYDRSRVDELVRRGQDALISDRALQREVKAEIENARGTLPIALRGYDREQVDSFLSALSAELASGHAGGHPEPAGPSQE